MINTEALVIGGGPVGQLAALCLQERGVSVQVLDAGGERAVRGRRGVELHRHHAVTQLYRRHGFVNVTGLVRHRATAGSAPEGNVTAPESFELKADYVVGADGYFSVCRRALGVELAKVRPTRAFVVCEFNADLRGWQRDACLAFSPDAVTAFWPLGPELGRFTIQVFESLDEAVSLDVFRELLRERAPWFEPVPEQLCWGAVAPFEHAQAQRFGEGRIWLAGDAAHGTSPIGFQSMNRGFCEARGLASAIAAQLFDQRPGEHPFLQFESEQQAEWVRLFGLYPRNAPTQWHLSELAPCLPASGEDFEALLDQLGPAAQVCQTIF